MMLVLLAALVLLAPAANAQCCGDCDGDGQVSINELITAVNSSLGMCSAAPTPTPPSGACPIDFRDDNTVEGTPDCYYIGRWNPSCGADDLEALWRSDGDIVIVELLGFDPGLFLGAEVTGASSADIIGWYTQLDASDLSGLDGTMTLGPMGGSLAIDPVDAAFTIEDCDFAHYRGALEDVVVPAALGAALRLRRGNAAALARLRAVAAEHGGRRDFRRRR
jgi:hypothetical protein